MILLQLNADLLDISQLYAEFAEPYNLWECQLAILHCAGHPDGMLIETVWNNIIEGEMSNTAELSSPNRINIMANKIAVLGKLYSSSHKYFPLGKFSYFAQLHSGCNLATYNLNCPKVI